MYTSFEAALSRAECVSADSLLRFDGLCSAERRALEGENRHSGKVGPEQILARHSIEVVSDYLHGQGLGRTWLAHHHYWYAVHNAGDGDLVWKDYWLVREWRFIE